MDIHVSSQAMRAMEAAARDTHPDEACGILLGSRLSEADVITAFVSAKNIHPAPQTHFEIDPQSLIDAHRGARSGGRQVLGYFHSHPSGEARPSATDIAMAASDGAIWAIYGTVEGAIEAKGIRFYRAPSAFQPRSGDGGFAELFIAEIES